jgi:hypothetical protein
VDVETVIISLQSTDRESDGRSSPYFLGGPQLLEALFVSARYGRHGGAWKLCLSIVGISMMSS